MIFIEKFFFGKKFFILFDFISSFLCCLCYYCSIYVKRQSELSGLRPDTSSLVTFCGFHKLFWFPQTLLRVPQSRLLLEWFWAIQHFSFLVLVSKTAKKNQRKYSRVASFAINLFLACWRVRLNFTLKPILASYCFSAFFCQTVLVYFDMFLEPI